MVTGRLRGFLTFRSSDLIKTLTYVLISNTCPYFFWILVYWFIWYFFFIDFNSSFISAIWEIKENSQINLFSYSISAKIQKLKFCNPKVTTFFVRCMYKEPITFLIYMKFTCNNRIRLGFPKKIFSFLLLN